MENKITVLVIDDEKSFTEGTYFNDFCKLHFKEALFFFNGVFGINNKVYNDLFKFVCVSDGMRKCSVKVKYKVNPLVLELFGYHGFGIPDTLIDIEPRLDVIIMVFGKCPYMVNDVPDPGNVVEDLCRFVFQVFFIRGSVLDGKKEVIHCQ